MLTLALLGSMFTVFGIGCLQGCATHSIPAPAGKSDEPRLSWTLSAGSKDDGRLKPVCGTAILTGCSLVRRPGKMVATLSIHLFAVGTRRIRYSGAAIIEFFDASPGRNSGYETTIDYTLKADDVPFTISINGNVRDDLDLSRFTITLFAGDPGATGDPQHVQVIEDVIIR